MLTAGQGSGCASVLAGFSRAQVASSTWFSAAAGLQWAIAAPGTAREIVAGLGEPGIK